MAHHDYITIKDLKKLVEDINENMEVCILIREGDKGMLHSLLKEASIQLYYVRKPPCEENSWNESEHGPYSRLILTTKERF